MTLPLARAWGSTTDAPTLDEAAPPVTLAFWANEGLGLKGNGLGLRVRLPSLN